MFRHLRPNCSSTKVLIAVAIQAGGVAAVQADENWPQWRGPQSNGVAAAGDYPVKFDAESGVAWKTKLPGLGMSTPAVWGDRIFVTCGVDGLDGVCAYDFTGKQLWQKTLGKERAGKNPNGSGSNPSPATDGEHVVVYFKSGTLACFDLNGNLAWQRNLQDDYGKDTLWWDLATSPVLVGDRVVIAVMHAGESFVAAFSLADGAPVWKTPRQYERPEESDQAYTTPQLAKLDGRDVIITFGADHLTAHDATSGELLWDDDSYNPRNKGMWRVIGSPVLASDVLFATFGRGEWATAIRLTPTGSTKIWERGDRGLASEVPTPIADGEKVYMLTDQGAVKCLDLMTGKELWSGVLPRNRNRYYASPVLAGGNLYCPREDGMLFVVGAGEGFELLSENNMGEKIVASPVPIRGGLLIRGFDHLSWVSGEATDMAAAASP
jgi:outer membrane protein assembly factor BamB